MKIDNFEDYPVTGCTAEEKQLIIDFQKAFFSYAREAELEKILAIQSSNSACMYAWCMVGMYYFFMGRASDCRDTLPTITSLSTSTTTEREKSMRHIVSALGEDDTQYLRAIDLMETHFAAYPADLLVSKLLGILHFNNGSSALSLKVAKAAFAYNKMHHYPCGILAFTLDEMGRYEEAEALGQEGTNRSYALGGDPWAHHAVAHSYDMRGELDKGIQWMDKHKHMWDRCSSFMYTHNWYHTLLFHMDNGAPLSELIEMYNQHIWNEGLANGTEPMGATSILWRLHVRFPDQRAQLEPMWGTLEGKFYKEPSHFKAYFNAFFDLHNAAGLGKLKLDHLQSFLSEMPTEGPYRYAKPLCESVVSYFAEDYKQSYEIGKEAIENLKVLGGSDAQRDIVEQTWLEILIRNQKRKEAEALLQKRIAMKGMQGYIQSYQQRVSLLDNE